ncbi:MAG: hypothetical protein M3440_08865 [Chloroflexota bacterium]|nr:hypothetical protein [Chloroflexota bacterium]
MSGERTLPIRWDLTGEDAIIQGADWRRYAALTYIDPADGLEKLWNTTGFTGRMQIRAGLDGALISTFLTGTGRLTVGIQGTAPDQYNVGIVLPNSVTVALTDWGLGVYDLELTDPFGIITRVYAGNCVLSREVTV